MLLWLRQKHPTRLAFEPRPSAHLKMVRLGCKRPAKRLVGSAAAMSANPVAHRTGYDGKISFPLTSEFWKYCKLEKYPGHLEISGHLRLLPIHETTLVRLICRNYSFADTCIPTYSSGCPTWKLPKSVPLREEYHFSISRSSEVVLET